MMAGMMTAMVTVLVLIGVVYRRARKAIMLEKRVSDTDSDAGSPIPVFDDMRTPNPPTKLGDAMSPIEHSSSTMVSAMTIATSPDSIDYDSDIIVDF